MCLPTWKLIQSSSVELNLLPPTPLLRSVDGAESSNPLICLSGLRAGDNRTMWQDSCPEKSILLLHSTDAPVAWLPCSRLSPSPASPTPPDRSSLKTCRWSHVWHFLARIVSVCVLPHVISSSVSRVQ